MNANRPCFLFAAALILACAAALRWRQIERRPFHADEGVQAYQTWKLLRGYGYTYDPADKHGPFLYYFSAGLTKLTGGTAATLTETRLRGITLLAGLATLTLLLTHAAALGRGPTLVTTALLATAPLTILYDTYFVQEAWFCFFTWALVLTVWRFTTRPSLPLAALIGLIAGLMQATKETSVLHFAALGVAWLGSLIRPVGASLLAIQDKDSREQSRSHTPVALLALTTFVLTYLTFYSAGFTQSGGILDGLRTYSHQASRAANSLHAQPWYYYFRLLAPHTQEGVRWGEPLLLLASAAGAFLVFIRSATPALRFIAVFTLTLFAIYSLIPYKTPWLLLTPYIGLCVLAAHAPFALFARSATPVRRLAPALALGAILLAGNLHRDRFALDRYANDPRNPYLYQPTSPDLTRLLAVLHAAPATTTFAIVSPDHAWPLPWYLRARPSVGYFATPPENLATYDLALLDSRLAPTPSIPADTPAFGLRPHVLLWLTHHGISTPADPTHPSSSSAQPYPEKP